MAGLFWAKLFKSCCATLQLPPPLWHARGHVLRGWHHKTAATETAESLHGEGCSGGSLGPTADFDLLRNLVAWSFRGSGGFGWCSIARDNPTPSDTLEVSARQVIIWPQDPQRALGVGRAQINSGRYKAHFTEESSVQHSTRDKILRICSWNKSSRSSWYSVRSNIFFLP